MKSSNITTGYDREGYRSLLSPKTRKKVEKKEAEIQKQRDLVRKEIVARLKSVPEK